MPASAHAALDLQDVWKAGRFSGVLASPLARAPEKREAMMALAGLAGVGTGDGHAAVVARRSKDGSIPSVARIYLPPPGQFAGAFAVDAVKSGTIDA